MKSRAFQLRNHILTAEISKIVKEFQKKGQKKESKDLVKRINELEPDLLNFITELFIALA